MLSHWNVIQQIDKMNFISQIVVHVDYNCRIVVVISVIGEISLAEMSSFVHVMRQWNCKIALDIATIAVGNENKQTSMQWSNYHQLADQWPAIYL